MWASRARAWDRKRRVVGRADRQQAQRIGRACVARDQRRELLAQCRMHRAGR